MNKLWSVPCFLLLVIAGLFHVPVHAGTYASAVTTFNWVDPSTHTQVGATTTPYKFNSGFGCATSLPTIDDNISDKIPMGFNFLFGDKVFDSVRINSNGRIHLVNDAIPWDNTTCGAGSAVTQIPFPNAGMNYVMRLYGNDLDPTPKRPGYTTVCADSSTAANNPCYVSFATIGTTPNRRFVVSWKGVPEWVSSGAKGAYDIQIIIQENGDFIYQYGPYVAGPAAKAAQIGYQLSTTNYDIAVTGFPAQNFAIRYFVPHPLVEYLMEQSSWSGSGSVLDTSGSNSHGSPVGAVSTVGSAKVCRGADIPSNANTNNIDAIDSGVNVSTDIGSAGTIAFWYKAKSAWSGASIKDAQLLDATIVDNQWFFVVRQSTGKVRFVVRDSTGADRIAETAAIATAANTWKHIAVTWNFNPMITANNNKVTVYVDGVQKAQQAFTSSTTSISSQLGTLYFGDNRSSFTGLNGTGRSADAVIDEVRIYNYELSQQGVASLMSLNSGCLDHYAITSSGSGSSCQVLPVTIASHTSTHGVYMNNNTVTLSTSDGRGNWSLIAGHGTLTPGAANSGSATYRFSAESQVVLGLLHPSGTVTAHVSDGLAADSENVPITITSTGCAPADFNAYETTTTAGAISGVIRTKLAGTAFSLDLAAINASNALETSFNEEVMVELVDPSGGGACAAWPAFYTLSPNPTFVAGTGRKTVTLTSALAKSNAKVRVTCAAPNCTPAVQGCSSDAFAIRPGAVTIPWGWATPPSATATPTISAGSSFLVSATTSTAPADNYAGTLALDASKLTAQTTSQDSTIQAGGTVGALTVTSPLIANESPSTGRATYSEVGYVYLAPGAVRDDAFTAVDQGSGDCISYNPLDPTNTDWLSASAIGGKFGCSIGNASAVSFGRFSPYTLDTTVTHACGSFTYSGQPFPLKVTAKNLSGGTTTNYTGKFANTLTFQDANGAAGAFTPTTLAATSFVNGVADLTAVPSVSFAFTDKLTAPATLKLRVMKLGAENSMVGNEGTTPLRSGRLRLSNKFGSEKVNLGLPVQAHYWSGQSWVLNTADSCTSLPGTAFFLVGANPGTAVQSGFTLASGVGTLTLTKPSPTATGSIDVAVNLGASGSDQSCLSTHGGTAANLPWLRSQNGNCAATYDRDPSARATFGIYAPETRKSIHVRESY